MWSKEHLLKLRENFRKAADSLTDADAVDTPEIFKPWAVGAQYPEGKRMQYNGELYKSKQLHTSQADWTPDIAISLYEKVAKPGDGTREHPIAYNGNLALENGKYYTQDNVLYYCFRDTGIAVYETLANLVGLYVEIAT